MPLISPTNTQPRSALRRKLRERRAGLAPDAAAAASAAAVERLTRSPEFDRAQRIAGYVAVRGEIDPSAALETAHRQGKTIYLPRIAEEIRLSFEPWRPGDTLHENRFSIPEPRAGIGAIAPEALDLVIVPLLAFDATGTRIGSGAGYYDRSFAFRHTAALPLLAGFAYALQECPQLPCAEWDVPLDLVVTEQGIARFSERSEA
ncbi:MAG: 5-formyltetrahydrofolate cyclo-ligase [Gammaproteobacteria bacterium]